MNEVFEMVAEVLEELRSEAGEREYSVCTKEAKNAAKELKRQIRNMRSCWQRFPGEKRGLLENIWILWIMPIFKRTKSVLSGNDRYDTDI